jgi:3-hydroxyisobutyrate dehydrogenase-like beta-hydroxyacid dehydrogenase
MKGIKEVGWIGLGKMGLPMSGRLLDAGYTLRVYDVDPRRMELLMTRGAKAADSSSSAASNAEYVFFTVPDDDALLEAVTGPQGVLKSGRPGTTLVDMGTHSPEVSACIAENTAKMGLHFLRAPVSGTSNYAAEGKLSVFASGPENVYRRCLPLLHALGAKIYHVGTGEEARYLKLLHNAMLGVIAMMTAEALVFGERGGLDWAQMVDVIKDSVVGSPVIGYKAEAIKERTFDLTFTSSQMAKDLDLALSAASRLHTPMPMVGLCRQFIEMMKAEGKGERDFFALIQLMEELAGGGER